LIGCRIAWEACHLWGAHAFEVHHCSLLLIASSHCTSARFFSVHQWSLPHCRTFGIVDLDAFGTTIIPLVSDQNTHVLLLRATILGLEAPF
jgi:hypothetical protein